MPWSRLGRWDQGSHGSLGQGLLPTLQCQGSQDGQGTLVLWTSPHVTQPWAHQDGDALGSLSPTWCPRAAGWGIGHFPSLLQDQPLMMSPNLLAKSVNYSAPHQSN